MRLKNLPTINFLRLTCAVLAGCILTFSTISMAADSTLPSGVFTAIMLKALNYDRNIDRIAKDKVIIGVVSFADDAQSQDFAGQVSADISKVQSDFTLKDKPMESKNLSLEGPFDKVKFEDQLRQDSISVLVVAVNDTSSMNNILQATKDLQISSICVNPGCAQNGVALEIAQKDDRPRMMINLNTVKQEGSDYNSKFLAMCEVVK